MYLILSEVLVAANFDSWISDNGEHVLHEGPDPAQKNCVMAEGTESLVQSLIHQLREEFSLKENVAWE